MITLNVKCPDSNGCGKVTELDGGSGSAAAGYKHKVACVGCGRVVLYETRHVLTAEKEQFLERSNK